MDVSTSSTTGESGWVLNGQKTWSSRAGFAHWGFGLFRSDLPGGEQRAERHHGLTYYLFPLDADGITRRVGEARVLRRRASAQAP